MAPIPDPKQRVQLIQLLHERPETRVVAYADVVDFAIRSNV